MTNYKSQIETLKKRIGVLKKTQRDETRKEKNELFNSALKRLQAMGLQVTATGGRFNYQYTLPGGDEHFREYSLSKVTYDPVKDVFFICAGIRDMGYNWRTDSYYEHNEFYSQDKNSIKPSSDRIREIKLGTLEDLLAKAEAAKKNLSAISRGERLRNISPAVAIQIIRQRKEQGLRTGFRESSLKHSDMDKMIDMLVEYRDFRATEVLYDPDLTTLYEPNRRIVFFPKLDVYLDLREDKNTTYLYGEENSAMKVIRQIRSNDNIFGPGGF